VREIYSLTTNTTTFTLHSRTVLRLILIPGSRRMDGGTDRGVAGSATTCEEGTGQAREDAVPEGTLGGSEFERTPIDTADGRKERLVPAMGIQPSTAPAHHAKLRREQEMGSAGDSGFGMGAPATVAVDLKLKADLDI
jgi:hypothetical protein